MDSRKNKKNTIIFFMIAGMVLFSSLACAYEVTVANYTSYKVHVNLYYREGTAPNVLKYIVFDGKFIEPNASYTWYTGTKCTSGLDGTIEADGRTYKLLGHWTAIQGDGFDGDKVYTASGMTDCTGSSWQICPKKQAGPPTKDNDYGFCGK